MNERQTHTHTHILTNTQINVLPKCQTYNIYCDRKIETETVVFKFALNRMEWCVVATATQYNRVFVGDRLGVCLCRWYM